MATLQKFKCSRCDKDFTAGDWLCGDGYPHEVKSKVYYMLDAPAYKEDCKFSRTVVCNVIPERKEMRGLDSITIPGVHVEFVRGVFETADPQLQVGLDSRKNIFTGEDGRAKWEVCYLSDTEKQEMDKMKLRAEVTRLQQEKNALLADIQARAKKPVAVGA
jgi:hypothetical protein